MRIALTSSRQRSPNRHNLLYYCFPRGLIDGIILYDLHLNVLDVL